MSRRRHFSSIESWSVANAGMAANSPKSPFAPNPDAMTATTVADEWVACNHKQWLIAAPVFIDLPHGEWLWL